MHRPKRVLFFAEAVTLAHVARPIALAKSLASKNYEVFIACDSRYQHFVKSEHWRTVPLHSISSQQFLRALARGKPVYDAPTLRQYVIEDRELIGLLKPDLIVGDFRLSLSVSARLAGVPYATVTNAYWSPFFPVRDFPLPVLPMTRFMPVSVARSLFRLGQRVAFGLHCRPLNQVRHDKELPSLGSDLRRVYTDADYVLYGDVPAMFPIEHLPKNHYFLGPILWTPPGRLPDWWGELPGDKPIIYLTLGSSGSARLMETALQALADQPITVIASTAGGEVTKRPPANAYIADYLPGTEAAARSSLVVCNGGSPTSQQALAAGVPVLGIAGNMDQFLNMEAVATAGAGVVVRADRVNGEGLRKTVEAMLTSPGFRIGARRLANEFASHDSESRFATFVADLMSRRE
jgi:UDP:flavonoid glycosyltransferase YjiC (YdhE family)